MKYRKFLTLRGPNVWAVNPAVEAWLDLERPEAFPVELLATLGQRLRGLLSCSTRRRHCHGHLQTATAARHLGDLLADVALELQHLAGASIRFTSACESHMPGVYKVVVEYQSEGLGRASLNTALRLLQAAIDETTVDVDAEVQKLCAVARDEAANASTAALLAAARTRGIPTRQLSPNGLLALGQGWHQRRILLSQTDHTSAAAEALCRDRPRALAVLKLASLPVPAWEVVHSEAEALEAADDLGLPVQIRPCTGLRPRSIRRNLHTLAQVADAYQRLALGDETVLVEKQASGQTWRLLVVGDRVVSTVARDADATTDVHPEVARLAVEAARVLGLDVAGVDIVANTLAQPLSQTGGVIAGVHPRPSLAAHLRPGVERQPVADAILDRLFPEGSTGRIPVVTITGTNGKTTTTRLTAHIFGRAFGPVGMCCSEGIYLDERLLEAGDCSGPNSARAVLNNPQARAAVLETARGGILREGLGLDYCDVAIVTNVAKGDHLGLGDVHTTDELARVKRAIVTAVGPGGTAVLNANDPLVVAMADHCRGDVLFFARNENHPVLAEHRGAGRRVAFVRNNHIILVEGGRELTLVDLGRVPLTHGGLVGFNVENCLAAAAASWCVGVSAEHIRIGLESFDSVLAQLPGRFNLLELNGATVVLDYAHNISALESFLEVVAQFPHPRRTAIYAVPGDRSDEVIRTQGELLGDAYDRVILYEDTELRGRQDGTIFALMREGLSKGGRTREVLEVRGNMKAIETGLALVGRGELLVVQPEFPDMVAEHFLGLVGRTLAEVDYDHAVTVSPAEPLVTVDAR